MGDDSEAAIIPESSQMVLAALSGLVVLVWLLSVEVVPVAPLSGRRTRIPFTGTTELPVRA